MAFRYQLIQTVVVAAVLFASVRSPADDQPSASDDQPVTTKLSLCPAGEPSPARRYRLLPSLIDLRPGNAAIFYNKAALLFSPADDRRKELDSLDEWLEAPLEKLPQAKVKACVDSWYTVIRELTLASRREECDWQTPLREQTPYTILLPEVQQLRAMARLMALKIRLEIAQGKIDDALDSLAIGYAMARHAATGPTLIQSLVGMAIGNIMTRQALEIAQRPDGPNLYWAYTSLPRPFVSLDRANEFEYDMLYFWHPEWRDRHHKPYSDAEWQEMWRTLATNMGEFATGWSGDAGQLRIVGRAIRCYPQAKRWLVDHGYTQDDVDAMPVAQVMVLYSLDIFDQLRDEQFKWSGLPYWQVDEHLQNEIELLRQATNQREVVPLAGTLLPAISNVTLSQARSDRMFCLARIIEALRLYAAMHDGQLPDTLADVTEVPIPHDPLTGDEFIYRLKDGAAVLETPLQKGLSQQGHGVRYEISISH